MTTTLSRRSLLAGLAGAAVTLAAHPASAAAILGGDLSATPRQWIGFLALHPELSSPRPETVARSVELEAACERAMLAVPASLYDPIADLTTWKLPDPYGHCADLALGRMVYLLERERLPLGALRPVTGWTHEAKPRPHAVLDVVTGDDAIRLDILRPRPVLASAAPLAQETRLLYRLKWERRS